MNVLCLRRLGQVAYADTLAAMQAFTDRRDATTAD
ncbi:MAG TPA: octanoyltransferase, partial [Gammaproteobacteria bacterium]|nr:octanoyltransferase [Gammaproteobacteria bacterium]